MIKVLLSRRWGSSRIWRGAIWSLSSALLPFATNATMAQPATTKTRPPEAANQDPAKSKAAAPADDNAPAPAPDVAAAPVVDPSQTHKVAPIEVFKDPNVEVLQLLDVNKVKALPPSPYTPADLLLVNEMAGNKNATLDRPVIDRVVRGLAAKLTDKASIQALIETPEEEEMPVGVANKAALKKAQAASAGQVRCRQGDPGVYRATPGTDLHRQEPYGQSRFLDGLPAVPQPVAAAALEQPPDPACPGDDRPRRER